MQEQRKWIATYITKKSFSRFLQVLIQNLSFYDAYSLASELNKQKNSILVFTFTAETDDKNLSFMYDHMRFSVATGFMKTFLDEMLKIREEDFILISIFSKCCRVIVQLETNYLFEACKTKLLWKPLTDLKNEKFYSNITKNIPFLKILTTSSTNSIWKLEKKTIGKIQVNRWVFFVGCFQWSLKKSNKANALNLLHFVSKSSILSQ